MSSLSKAPASALPQDNDTSEGLRQMARPRAGAARAWAGFQLVLVVDARGHRVRDAVLVPLSGALLRGDGNAGAAACGGER